MSASQRFPLRNAFDSLRGLTIGGKVSNIPGAKMRTPIPDHLRRVLEAASQDNEGQTAQYIPELQNANPDRVALALSTMDGIVYGVGDTDEVFSIQSISKAFVYALALEERYEDVIAKVGVEPSGEAFNELSLETDTCRPLNPMINAGAITIHTLVGSPDGTWEDRFEAIRSGLSKFAGRELDVDEAVFDSEMKTAFRNKSIANMLRNYKIVHQDPDDIVTGYTRQCAINVTTRDLALMSATLANGGRHPVTEEQVVRPAVVKQVLSVMMSCGMYDGAGDWLVSVGIPAKSGVAGGIIGSLPAQVGLATFSPRLDKHGNSVRGVRMFNRLSKDMGLHIMDTPEPSRSVVRRHYLLRSPDGKHSAGVLSLQGAITFPAAERIIRTMSMRSAESCTTVDGVVLDLRNVYSIDFVSRRMLREAVKRLRDAGFDVHVADPDLILYPKEDKDKHPPENIVNDLTKLADWTREATPESMVR